MKTLGERLTEERQRLGSLRAAARAMGVAAGTYEGWEKGWRQPKREQYDLLAAFFDVPKPVILWWVGLLTEDQAQQLAHEPRSNRRTNRSTGLYLGSMVPAAA